MSDYFIFFPFSYVLEICNSTYDCNSFCLTRLCNEYYDRKKILRKNLKGGESAIPGFPLAYLGQREKYLLRKRY